MVRIERFHVQFLFETALLAHRAQAGFRLRINEPVPEMIIATYAGPKPNRETVIRCLIKKNGCLPV